jgi:hypothetical protein
MGLIKVKKLGLLKKPGGQETRFLKETGFLATWNAPHKFHLKAI